MIDAPAHPDAQAVARRIHPDTITNNVIRAALDLQRGGDHDVEIPPATTLKEYFGEYSVSGKAYRTYGGSNKAFGELARILMEYAFVHTNPTSMPQIKATIIINAYEGNRIDWGIITGEGLRAALASFQSGKKMLSVITHFLTVLYPPSSLSSPRALSSPPPPRKQREKLNPHPRSMGGAHAPFTSCDYTKPSIGATTTTNQNTPEKGTTRHLPRMGGGGRHRGQCGRGCHYSAENATTLGGSPTAEPAPHHSAGSITTASETQAGRGTNTTGPRSPSTTQQQTKTQP